MKRSLLKYLFVIISFGLFSTKLFSQSPVFTGTPADPGDDPMKADSARYPIVLQQSTNNQTKNTHNFLPKRKDSVFTTIKSDSLYLRKNNQEHSHTVF
jgi:hypothetical protein